MSDEISQARQSVGPHLPRPDQFRAWADRLRRLVHEMEATAMHDGTPVLCAARAALYVALSTAQAAEEPRVPDA